MEKGREEIERPTQDFNQGALPIPVPLSTKPSLTLNIDLFIIVAATQRHIATCTSVEPWSRERVKIGYSPETWLCTTASCSTVNEAATAELQDLQHVDDISLFLTHGVHERREWNERRGREREMRRRHSLET